MQEDAGDAVVVETNENDRKMKVITVTANIGTLCECLDDLCDEWLNEVSKVITNQADTHFIALHLQEVGGKDYEISMCRLDYFIKALLKLECLKNYKRYCMLLNTDYTYQHQFTALGSMYFVSDLVTDVFIFNFMEKKFEKFIDCLIFSGSLIDVAYVKSQKFESNFFPLVKWSRKGFAHTKWRLGSADNNIVNFVNIHMFHDVSNLIAAKKSPSIYSRYRHGALLYTLDQIDIDQSEAIFIFGDFNFRINLNKLLEDLFEKTPTDTESSDGKMVLKKADEHGEEITAFIGKKDFCLKLNGQSMDEDYYRKIMNYDEELNRFSSTLFEPTRSFCPSYPYSEDIDKPHDYLNTRCPSWCDRILMNKTCRSKLIENDDNEYQPHYGIIGMDVCMGDHKPVYFATELDFSIESKETPAKPPSLILNGMKLVDPDPQLWNVHHNATFLDKSSIVSEEMLELLNQNIGGSVINRSRIGAGRRALTRWTKIRAVSYFVGSRIHRRGSWYTCDSDSDEQTCPSSQELDTSVDCSKQKEEKDYLAQDASEYYAKSVTIDKRTNSDEHDGRHIGLNAGDLPPNPDNSDLIAAFQLGVTGKEYIERRKRRRPFTKRKFRCCRIRQCCLM